MKAEDVADKTYLMGQLQWCGITMKMQRTMTDFLFYMVSVSIAFCLHLVYKICQEIILMQSENQFLSLIFSLIFIILYLIYFKWR